jgi:methionine-rich copper-binding protein CopC
MRLLTRLLALSVTSATLAALAPGGTAFAAATRTGEFPAAGTVATTLSTISTTFTDTILAPGASFTVAPPAGDTHFACTPATVTSHSLSCTPTHVGAAAFTDGVYTVNYSFNSVPGGATSGSYTFVLDANAPASLAISPSPYNLTTTAGAPVVVSGTSFAGATVKVTLGSSGGGSPVTQTATATGGTFSSSFAAPADGTLTATAAVTSGGTDGPSASVSSLKDRTLPSLVSTSPVDGGAERSNTGGTPNGFTVTADGPLDHTTRLQLFDSTHTEIATTTTFPTANQARIVTASPLPEGSYTVQITLVDAAGNSQTFPIQSFAIDDTAPAAPVLSLVTDPVNLANKAAFGASGTAEAGAQVTVSITTGASTVTATTTATGGSFSVSGVDVSALADGSLAVTATATDAAGNTSGISNALAPVKDTIVPVLSGQAFDQTTYNAATAPTAHVSGVVGDGAGGHEADTVTVSVDDTDSSTGAVVGTAPADGTTGAFSVPLNLSSLKDTALTATVTTVDAHGNAATPVTATAGHDSVSPAQPTVVAPAYANLANQTAYVVSGTTDASVNVTVTVTDGTGSAAASVTANGSGTYTASLDVTALADGPLSVSVVALDAHGNASTPGTASRTKDTVAPSAPTGLTAPTWVNTGNTAAVPVSGSGEAGATVTVQAHDPGSAHLATGTPTTVLGDGTWSTAVDTSAFDQGTATFDVTLTDPAGNTGAPATATSTKDTVAPTAATGLASAPTAYLFVDRNGTLTVTGSTQNDNTLVVDLTIADTDPATSDLTMTGVTTAAGAFSHAFTAGEIGSLTDGTLTVTAVVRDPAGNSSPSSTLPVVKDTTALAQLSLTPADGSVHQSVLDVTAGFNEALDPAASTVTVKNHLGNTLAGAVTFSLDGKTMTFTPNSPFTDPASPYTVTVHGVDLNDSGDTVSSGPTTFSVDTTPPAAPVITSVTDPVSAASATAFATSGTADPTATTVTIDVTSGVQSLSTTVPVTGGSWSVSSLDVSSLPDGTLTVAATAQDAYGNVSTVASTTATKDTVAPVMTVQFAYDQNGIADMPAVMISGTEGDGSGGPAIDTVTLSVDDTDPSTPTVHAPAGPMSNGTFSTTMDLRSLTDGTLTVTAFTHDAAGNRSADATGTTVKDTVAPAAPVFTVAETVSPTGRTLVATGTAEPGSDVTLGAFDASKNGPLTNVVANPTTGAFSTRLDLTGLADAPLAVGALATDAAFNDSPAAFQMVPTATSITVDPATAANHFVLTVHGKLAEPAQLALAVGDGTSTLRGGTFVVDQSTGAFTGTLDVTALAPGQLLVALTTKDADGNTALVLSSGSRAWGTSSVALYTIASRVVAGTPITLRGTVTRTDPSVAVGLVQVVGRDAYGHVKLRKNIGVSSTGAYALRYAPPVTMSFTVTYLGDTHNSGATSVRRSVVAAAKVSASAPTGSHTRKAVLSGGVFPNKAGKVVTLYRVTSTGALVRLQTARLSSRSTYVFSVLLPKGYTTLVVGIPATPGNAAGSIRFRALRT